MTSAESEAPTRTLQPSRAADPFVLELAARFPHIEVLAPAPATRPYGHDAATAKSAGTGYGDGPAVVFPANAEQVQQAVRLAADLGVTVVPRGAGTGLSGGAAAGA